MAYEAVKSEPTRSVMVDLEKVLKSGKKVLIRNFNFSEEMAQKWADAVKKDMVG